MWSLGASFVYDRGDPKHRATASSAAQATTVAASVAGGRCGGLLDTLFAFFAVTSLPPSLLVFTASPSLPSSTHKHSPQQPPAPKRPMPASSSSFSSSSSSSFSSSTHARRLQAAAARPRPPPCRTPFLALDSEFHKKIASFLTVHAAVKAHSICRPPSPNPFTDYGVDETLVLSRRLLEEAFVTDGGRIGKATDHCTDSLSNFLHRMRQQIKVVVVDTSKSPVSGCILSLDQVLGEAIRRVQDVNLLLHEITIRGGPLEETLQVGKPHSLVEAMAKGKTFYLCKLKLDSRFITLLSVFELGEGVNPQKLAEAIANGHLPFLNHLQIMPRSLPFFLEASTDRLKHDHKKKQQANELEVIRRDMNKENLCHLASLLVLPYFHAYESLDFSVNTKDAEAQVGKLGAYVYETKGAPCLRRITICIPESYTIKLGRSGLLIKAYLPQKKWL